MKEFKKIAEKYGFELWWDRNICLWTLTKEGMETDYYTKIVLEVIGAQKFENSLKVRVRTHNDY